MKISVPATSANLGPGFDSLGLAVDLRNYVIVKPAKFHSVSLKGEGANIASLKDNNMFVSIFNDFYYNLTTKKRAFRFEFFNEIPLTRGLGSSSAVITSAIASAYALEGVKIEKEKLLNLALAYEKHPDNITPAIMGGFTASVVESNEVRYLRKAMPNSLKAVLVIPNRPMSTQLSRKVLPYRYSKEESIFNLSHAALMSASFFSENWEMLKSASKDKLHQVARMRLMPELFEVQKVALNSGALMSTLSGSGSTLFSMVYASDAKRIEKKLREKFSHFKVITVDFDNNGIKIEI